MSHAKNNEKENIYNNNYTITKAKKVNYFNRIITLIKKQNWTIYNLL